MIKCIRSLETSSDKTSCGDRCGTGNRVDGNKYELTLARTARSRDMTAALESKRKFEKKKKKFCEHTGAGMRASDLGDGGKLKFARARGRFIYRRETRGPVSSRRTLAAGDWIGPRK